MLTPLTHLSTKDVEFLQPHKTSKWCQRQLEKVKRTTGKAVVLVRHLADFWGVDDDDIITQLRPRFAL